MGISKAAARSSSFARRSFPRRSSSIRSVRSKKDLPTSPAAEEKPQYEVGQKVVYAGYGVGQVQAIESKVIAGMSLSGYKIRVLENDVILHVPLNKTEKLRPIASKDEVEKVLGMLRDRKVVVEQSTWNRRSREYNEKINTGSIFEITEVLRDLCVLRADKVLSFGEKRMLDLAKGLLVKELAISQDSDEPTVEAQIEEIFA